MSWTIRMCTTEDLPQVRRLYRDCLAEEGPGTAVDDSDMPERLGEFFLVAEQDGCAVGYVIGAAGPVDDVGRAMAEDVFPNEGPYLEVQNLYVAPAARRRGIASALMKTLIQRGLDRGLKRSMVYSANRDYGAIGRFYERFGYRIWHIFMMRGPGEPAV